jgi:hypothetical protein
VILPRPLANALMSQDISEHPGHHQIPAHRITDEGLDLVRYCNDEISQSRFDNFLLHGFSPRRAIPMDGSWLQDY